MHQTKLVKVQEKITGSVKRCFCPNGLVDPRYHFYIDPSEWNEKNLIPQLKIGHYPLLVAPSQSGKTTRVNKLLDQLKDQFLPIYIDILGIVDKNQSSHKFYEEFFKEFSLKVEKITGKKIPTLSFESSSFYELFKFKEEYYDGKDCILILDELDSISNLHKDIKNRFLSMLRTLKQKKIQDFESNCLHSVLGITNWAGDYIYDTLGSSPFNISNKIVSSYFTLEEVNELFNQYEIQENIKIESEIKKNIFEQSEGAQGLTTLFGKYLSEVVIGEKKTVPTTSEWKSLVYGMDLFDYARDESVNFGKMIKLIDSDVSCLKTLYSFFQHQDIYTLYPQESNILQRANILRKSSGKFIIASPFVEKWLLFSMNKQIQQPLITLPYLNDNLNIPAIVKATIENIKIVPLIFGEKLSENKCLSKETPGCKESIYRVEFYQSLKQTLSNFQSIRYNLEKNVPLDKFSSYKSSKLKSHQFPQQAISCDMLMKLDQNNIYLIEHGVNLSLNLKPSYNTTSTLWHHVYRQGELYHFGLKAKETWVINWTTVDPKKLETKKYWFPKSSTVKTMYIYHSSDFSTFKIYIENQKEIIVKKKNPIQFGEKKRKLNQFEDIDESISKIPKIQDKNVILRKYGQKKGGIEIQLPEDLKKLLGIGNEYLKVKAIKIRKEPPIEAEIVNINSIQNNQILYFTTEEDEKEFQE